MIRTFIAIELSDEIRAEIARVEDILREEGGDVRWVRPENLHLTLKFLGDLEEGRIEEVVGGVRNAAQECAPFELVLFGAGAFPNFRRPRVIWIGAREEGGVLKRVHRNIEDELSRSGFPRDRKRFSPHLTIGRVRSARGMESVAEALQRVEIAPRAMTVEEIAVMKSDLRPTGPIYTRLGGAKLGG